MLTNSDLAEVSSNLKRIKTTNHKIYGIMAHGLIPEEIIYAAGGFPLRLWLSGGEQVANKGIEYLTAVTCSFARSTIGHMDLKNAVYKEIDAIVGGNYCNGELCTTELISEYFTIPRIEVVLPSTKRQNALKFMAAELQHFKEEIEKFENVQITNMQILEAIQLYNKERRLIQDIVSMQETTDYTLSGVECLELLYKHYLYGVEVAIENFQTVKSDLETRSSKNEGKKVIFAGNGVPIGDNVVHQIEDQGFKVIKNLTWTGLDYYTSLVSENEDIFNNLASYYINAENSGRMLLSDDYFSDLVNVYADSNADGVIFYVVKQCSIIPALISLRLKETLTEKGIPYLEIEREYGVPFGAQFQTRLQAFKEMIK